MLVTSAVVLISSAALAGPNARVTLTPHGNVDCLETGGDICSTIQLPATCEELNPDACPDPSGVEWYLIVAVAPPGVEELAFTTITFGLGDYIDSACYVARFGPCFQELGPVQIPSAGWPGPNSGTSVTWAPECLTGGLVPVYYFGFYVYYGGGTVPLGDFYPGQTAAVASCDAPFPVDDPIEDPDGDGFFGILGCGEASGKRECPLPRMDVGVCCVDTDGDGVLETCAHGVSEDECFHVLDGTMWFPGELCGPDNEPCPQEPISTRQTSWDRIRTTYED
jgi:hypothetical protein